MKELNKRYEKCTKSLKYLKIDWKYNLLEEFTEECLLSCEIFGAKRGLCKVTGIQILTIVPFEWPFLMKNCNFDPQKCEFVEIISILIPMKNYTSKFSDTPLGSDNCISSKAFLTPPSNQLYFNVFSKYL